MRFLASALFRSGGAGFRRVATSLATILQAGPCDPPGNLLRQGAKASPRGAIRAAWSTGLQPPSRTPSPPLRSRKESDVRER